MELEAADLNLSSIAKYFSDEGEAYALVEAIRWPNGPICPHCGSIDRAYRLRNQKTRSGKVSQRRLWKCRECRQQFTCTIGTIFEDSHIPLSKWLLGAFLVNTGKNGVSVHELRRSLNISLKAAWFMGHRLRYAMARIPSNQLLSGIVEADETYVGGKQTQEERRERDNKVPVVTLVQRDGELRSQVMKPVSGKNIKQVIEKNVQMGSQLMTDGSTLYDDAGMDYIHQTVDHSREEWVRGNVHVNTAEGFFSQLKRSLDGTYRRLSERHLPRYLAESDYRHNMRKVKDGHRTVAAMKKNAGKLSFAGHGE